MSQSNPAAIRSCRDPIPPRFRILMESFFLLFFFLFFLFNLLPFCCRKFKIEISAGNLFLRLFCSSRGTRTWKEIWYFLKIYNSSSNTEETYIVDDWLIFRVIPKMLSTNTYFICMQFFFYLSCKDVLLSRNFFLPKIKFLLWNKD